MDSEPRRSLFHRLRQILGVPSVSTSEELEQEITGLVDHGEARGLLTHREGQMIEAILDLDETTAAQVMVPRIDMATVAQTASLDEVIEVIVDSGHSRIPATGEDLDHIVGVIYAKDLLSFRNKPPEDFRLASYCRKPFFVPQSMPIDQLLSEFKRRRVHLAVVVDEYGGTAGLVTMEDVLEEIVGEISDEYDHEEAQVAEQIDGSLLVDARLEVEKLAELIGTQLPEELPEGRFETVGGFITTFLGRVPRAQEEITYGSLRMVVVGADDRRITQVQIHYTPPQENHQGD